MILPSPYSLVSSPIHLTCTRSWPPVKPFDHLQLYLSYLLNRSIPANPSHPPSKCLRRFMSRTTRYAGCFRNLYIFRALQPHVDGLGFWACVRRICHCRSCMLILLGHLATYLRRSLAWPSHIRPFSLQQSANIRMSLAGSQTMPGLRWQDPGHLPAQSYDCYRRWWLHPCPHSPVRRNKTQPHLGTLFWHLYFTQFFLEAHWRA